MLHQFISAATVYRCHHWPGDDNCVPLSAALWTVSGIVLGRRAFRVCGPATWNALPTELRTDTFGKHTENLLVRERLLRAHQMTSIDCLFCAIQMRVLIDS